MLKTLTFIRRNAIALCALFVALGGTSYAALSLPARKRRHSTAQEPGSHRGEAEPDERRGECPGLGDSDLDRRMAGAGIEQRHPRSNHGCRRGRDLEAYALCENCMASVTPQRNFGPGGLEDLHTLDGYVSTFFDPRAGTLQIDGIAADGAHQAQSVTVLIVCPSPGSQK